jgi:hypothetical protein
MPPNGGHTWILLKRLWIETPANENFDLLLDNNYYNEDFYVTVV